MAGVFDIRKGAFDSSEASRLHQAYEIALHGLRASHDMDPSIVHRLSRSVVKVARNEPDCLNNDGTIDPARLAQRAILRMLQVSAPSLRRPVAAEETPAERRRLTKGAVDDAVPRTSSSTATIMRRLFDRTIFAKV